MVVHSPEWLERQYNNRLRVVDSEAWLARWALASRFVRENSRCVLDQAYDADSSARLDLFLGSSSDAPILLMLHGGWWRSLDKSDLSFVASAFTEQGALVVVPNYPLCPAVSLDRIPLQLTQALAWLWRHASEFGGDPNRIVLVGHSAGGHLASMLACCDWKAVAPDLPRQLVKGLVSISGINDLAPIRKLPFLQADLRLDAQAVRRLSPARFPAPNASVYSFVGELESEEFKRQNRLLRQAWGSKTVPICEEVPGCHHFDILNQLVDPESRVHLLTRKLLDLRWYSPLL